jgi:hypothetical protein
VAILRERRQEAVHRVYHRSAILFFILAVIAAKLAWLVPVTQPGGELASPEWQSLAMWAFVILIGAIVVWTAHRKLIFLLSLLCLALAATYIGAALGNRLAIGTEATLPETLTDPAALLAFIQQEVATKSPFFETIKVNAQQPFPLGQSFVSVPVLSNLMPSTGGPSVSPTVLLYAGAALLILATLVLWRAIRNKP